jgi:hemerythrin-like metal-binding protein
VAYLTWKDEYAVGVALMDAEHRELLEIVNQLYEALSSGGDPLPLCDALARHALVHFAHEEQWFAPLGYPRANQHRLMHEKLTQRLVDYRAQLSGEARPGIDDFARFADWLAHHITGEDRAYAAWLNAQGIH